MTSTQEPFIGNPMAPDTTETNWLFNYEMLSMRDAEFLNLVRQRERLAGELWRALLSSELYQGVHMKQAEEMAKTSGEPMAYWTHYASTRPGSKVIGRNTEFFIPWMGPVIDQINALDAKMSEVAKRNREKTEWGAKAARMAPTHDAQVAADAARYKWLRDSSRADLRSFLKIGDFTAIDLLNLRVIPPLPFAR